MIRRPPRSTLFPYTTPLPISSCSTSPGSSSTPSRFAHEAASSGRRSAGDRKSTRLNSSHGYISYAVFCLKKKNKDKQPSHAQLKATSKGGVEHSEPKIAAPVL